MVHISSRKNTITILGYNKVTPLHASRVTPEWLRAYILQYLNGWVMIIT